MYKRILVGIDDRFSESGVLEKAIGLTRQTGGVLAICHALDVAHNPSENMMILRLEEIQAERHASAMAFMEDALKIAKDAGIPAEIILTQSTLDSVPDMLVQAANDWNADLLVIGENERGLERFFVDSIGETLLRESNISLLIVNAAKVR